MYVVTHVTCISAIFRRLLKVEHLKIYNILIHIQINNFLKIPTASAKDLEASGQINHPTTRLVLVGYMHKKSVLFEDTDKIPLTT